MKTFREILNLQDNFYMQFTILFKGERRIHSKWGVAISLLINLACVGMFVTLLLELIGHKKPDVTIAQLNSQITTNMTFNTKDLLFTVGLRDKYFQAITDPSIAKLIPVYQLTTSTNNTLIQEQIEMSIINCTVLYSKFEELGVGDIFNSTGLKDYNCFKRTKGNEDVILGGKYGTDFYGNLAFYVKKCRNDTEPGLICKPEEVINSYVQDGWLQITYVSTFIDFNNFTSPVQYKTEDFYSSIDVNLNKIVYSYFMPVIVSSENNIIFSNQKIETVFKNDKQITDINLAKENGVVYTIYVCPSFNVERYYRRYVKIQEIGASIGGFWSGLSIVGIVLLTFPQLQDFQMKIANSLFDFASENRIHTNRSIYIPCKNKETTVNQSCFKKKQQYKVDLGLKNVIKLFLCPLSTFSKEMKKEYDKMQKELFNYIDFAKASEIFQEVSCIKQLLIDKNITSIFNIHKKIIDLSHNKVHKSTPSNSSYFPTNKDIIQSKKIIPLEDMTNRYLPKTPMINTLIGKSTPSDNDQASQKQSQ